MNIHRIIYYSIFSLVFSFCALGVAVTSLHAAEAKKAPVAQKKPTAEQRPVADAKIQPLQVASKTPQPQASSDRIKSSLDTFARNCITTMNKQRMPGIYQKEVKRQPDGTFMARYLAFDPDSLETSYNPTTGYKTITHIGRMDYHEVEYVSLGPDQKQALAGPFNEVNRFPITELIKYKQGKWTY